MEAHLTWFEPLAISSSDLRNFSAFANVDTLKLQFLQIARFIPNIKHYFGHFSPRLRSITLIEPYCTPGELSYFISLFSNLDDIEIGTWFTYSYNPEPERVPFSTPRLRGRLELRAHPWVSVWTHLIASWGGLRFRYMDLPKSAGCAPILLEACANTLETLRLHADASLGGK